MNIILIKIQVNPPPLNEIYKRNFLKPEVYFKINEEQMAEAEGRILENKYKPTEPRQTTIT